MAQADNDGAAASIPALARVRVVLVGTTHPGNIGATARAMKVMGLEQLHLVQPARFPAAEATAMAAGADDLLARAEVHESLEGAVAGCALVFGTTARERHIDWPTVTPRDAAGTIAGEPGPVAMVFGRERSGLTNAELERCQRAVCIPTADTFRSLNLAQAVQICAYELRLAHAGDNLPGTTPAAEPRADAVALDNLTRHCLAVMARVGYHDPARPKLLERRLARLFGRAELRHSEAQILRGFLSAIENRIGADDDA